MNSNTIIIMNDNNMLLFIIIIIIILSPFSESVHCAGMIDINTESCVLCDSVYCGTTELDNKGGNTDNYY